MYFINDRYYSWFKVSKQKLVHIKKMLFEMNEKRVAWILYNDKNKPNGNRLRIYGLYKIV